jgi:hypothetical protein
MRADTEAEAGLRVDDQDAMSTSYAVTWQMADEASHSGRLELQPRALVFEGTNGDGAGSETIPYGDVARVRIARSPEDRLSGRQTLVLERRSGDRIRIASVGHPGIITELAERLASPDLGDDSTTTRAVVVLPLVEGAADRVAELLRGGPPFDPEEVGLGRHQVFVTESEAIFLFEAASSQAADQLLSDDRLWAAAAAWKDVVAGPPRLAEDAYSWWRPKRTDFVSFEPTPGPGDSDGGDIF